MWAYSSTKGDYSVLVWDGDTKIVDAPLEIDATSVDCTDAESCARIRDFFGVFIPIGDASYTRVELLHKGVALGGVDASAHAPEISGLDVIDNPDGSSDVVWTATDADNDELLVKLQYSVDGKETWDSTLYGEAASSYHIEQGSLPAVPEIYWRASVSDGVLAALAEAGPFAVENTVPQIEPFARFDATDVAYPGDAIQAEAKVLVVGARTHDVTVTWESTLDGVIGTGEKLNVPVANLSPGFHVITATATDADGLVGARSGVLRVMDSRSETAPEAPADAEVITLLQDLVEARNLDSFTESTVTATIKNLGEDMAAANADYICYGFEEFYGYRGRQGGALMDVSVADRGALGSLAEVLGKTYGCVKDVVEQG